MLSFISFFTVILLLLVLYLGHRFQRYLHLNGSIQWILWIALGSFLILQIIGPLMYRFPSMFYLDPTTIPFISQWLTYSTLGIFSSFLMWTFFGDLLLLISNFFKKSPTHSKRRLFLMFGGVSITSSFVGTYQALSGPELITVDIPISHLPPHLNGLKIAQISDLHIGPLIGEDYVRWVVQKVLSTEPDLVVITGDIADGRVQQLESHLSPLKELKAPYGVFYCTGNHEYYWNVQEWVQKMRSFNFIPLMNEHMVISVNKSNNALTDGALPLVIAGVTDLHGDLFLKDHECSPQKAFQGAPQEGLKILLAHQPNVYKKIDQLHLDVHLQLSGHTHGGQFYPFRFLVKLAQRYIEGLHLHEGKTWIYVNRGTGFWGPPQRLGVPSEITLLQLRPEDDTHPPS